MRRRVIAVIIVAAILSQWRWFIYVLNEGHPVDKRLGSQERHGLTGAKR